MWCPVGVRGKMVQVSEVRGPDWVRHAIWWQVFPLGACGAEAVKPGEPGDLNAGPVQHRLPALIGWLDYAIELGCSGISLGPLFSSYSHGYDTLDYYRVDSRLGDRADFDALIRAAHDRGLKVLLDGVFNHVGRDNPWFADAVAHGPGSAQEALFQLTWPDGAAPGTTPDYANFEGHTGLMTLNHANPAVADLVTDVMCHWLEAGIDGWRLDAAYAVPPAFWTGVLPRVRERFPHVYVVGEVIHGDYPQIVADSGMDSVTQYELWKAVWSGINDRNLHELEWALRRHREFMRTFVPQTFVGNHDVTRIASQITDPADVVLPAVILFTVGGCPSVYYGDDQGYHGVKEERLGGDDQIRPVLPDSPSAFSALGRPIHDRYVELIGLRRRHPWLYDAVTRTREVSNEVFVYESVPSEQGETAVGHSRTAIVVALNVGDESVQVEAHGVHTQLAGTGSLRPGRPGVAPALRVPAHGWSVAAAGDAG